MALDERPALGVEEGLRLMRDGVINYMGIFVSSLVGIVLVPIMVGGLGVES
jgi:hypothetical protein